MKFPEKKDGFDLSKVIEFCKKNIRYISAAVVVVVLVIVLAVTAAKPNTEGKQEPEGKEDTQEDLQDGQGDGTEVESGNSEFQVDAVPEINTLIQNYYTAYAAGDTAALETYATPITELEKNYITLMSQYVAAYENVQCHTKEGLAEGEYAVSVTMDMRLEGVESTAPGLDFFYVRKNGEGTYYIDNLYCSFNQENHVMDMDSQVENFISEYEKQEDFMSVFQDVQGRYDAALAADENLKNKLDVEIPQGIQNWLSALASAASGNDQQPEEPVEPDQQPEAPAEPDQQPEAPAEPETPPEAPAEPETPSDGQGESNSGLSYVPEGTVLTASDSYNIRVSMSETSDKMGTTAAGDEITVVMSYAEGWTKVEWNGKTGYIRTDLLLAN